MKKSDKKNIEQQKEVVVDKVLGQDNNENVNLAIIPIIVSNSYIEKYYIDTRLQTLPKEVKDTLKVIFVEFTGMYGGIVEVDYDNVNYGLIIRNYKNDDDYEYDEIEAGYKLSKIEKNYEELFDDIAKFCKFKFNGLV